MLLCSLKIVATSYFYLEIFYTNLLNFIYLLILSFLFRFKKVPVTNLIVPFIPDSRNGVMIISISRFVS